MGLPLCEIDFESKSSISNMAASDEWRRLAKSCKLHPAENLDFCIVLHGFGHNSTLGGREVGREAGTQVGRQAHR